MKNLVLMSLVFFSVMTASQSFARNHCRQQNNRCEQNLTRADVFKEIYSIEGNTSEAQTSVRIIESVAQDLRISIHTSAANYIYVLNFVGGAGYTQVAQSVFKDLVGYVNGRRELADVVDAFYDIYKIEGNTTDSFVNLRIASNIANEFRFRLSEAVSFYLKILNLHGGPGYSQVGQSTANDLISQANRFRVDIVDTYNTYADIYRLEGNTSDSLTTLVLVLRGADACGSLNQALNEYLSILNSVGGPGYTQVAQQTYKDLFGL